MADMSVFRMAGDLGPLKIQTPPKTGYGAVAIESPSRLQFAAPRDSLSTNPQPPSYIQATSAPAYKQIPSFYPQKESTRSSSSGTASRSGTPNLVLRVPPTRRRIPYRQRPRLVDEFCKPEGLRRNYVFLAFVCAIGIPTVLALIALIIYLCIRPQLPRVTINAVNVMRFNAVGGLESSGQNPTLNLDLGFVLLAMNPNKKLTMHYQEMSMLVSFQNISFPVAVFPPFSQAKDNITAVNTRVRVANAALAVDDGMFLQFCISRGDVPLRALIDVKASVQTGRWKTPSFRAHWACDLDISPPSVSRNPMLLSKSCKRARQRIPGSRNVLD